MQLSILSFQPEHLAPTLEIRYFIAEAAQYVMALNFQHEFELLYIDLNLKPNGKRGIIGLKLIRDAKKAMHHKFTITWH